MFVLDTNHVSELTYRTAAGLRLLQRHDATLLTRNLADFKPVPGLRVVNWLD